MSSALDKLSIYLGGVVGVSEDDFWLRWIKKDMRYIVGKYKMKVKTDAPSGQRRKALKQLRGQILKLLIAEVKKSAPSGVISDFSVFDITSIPDDVKSFNRYGNEIERLRQYFECYGGVTVPKGEHTVVSDDHNAWGKSIKVRLQTEWCFGKKKLLRFKRQRTSSTKRIDDFYLVDAYESFLAETTDKPNLCKLIQLMLVVPTNSACCT